MSNIHQNSAGQVILKDQPEDFAELGISPQQVSLWEDGRRSDPATADYEWWYFDCALEDGSKMVIVFQTKPYEKPEPGARPLIKFTLTRPGGKTIGQVLHFDAADCSAAKERCDVRFGLNRFEGNLHQYTIHVEFGDLVCDVAITSEVPSWRPGVGLRYFGDRFYGWVVAVPGGEAQVTLCQGGKKTVLKGNAYHDHNWGDAPMPSLINNWYWGRGRIGDYVFVLGYVTAEKEYGYSTDGRDFMLAKGGRLVAPGGGKFLTLEEDSVVTDEETQKPYGQRLNFVYRDGREEYRLAFQVDSVIERELFHDEKGGAYMRFAGNVKIEQVVDGKAVDSAEAVGIWERMYFGQVLAGV